METASAVSAIAAEAKGASRRNWRLALLVIRVGGSAGLVYWILRDSSMAEIFGSMGSASLPLLMLAFSLHFVGYYVSSVRWRLLLKTQGVSASLPFLIKSYVVATFFNSFLPSSVGGDAMRAYDSWRLGHKKVGAAGVIFVDRLLGMLVLALFATGALLVVREIAEEVPYLHLWVSAVSLGILSTVWMIFNPPREVGLILEKVLARTSGLLRRLSKTVADAFEGYRGRKGTLAKAMGLSLVLQANVVVFYYAVGTALGIDVPVHAFFLIVPVAIIVMMVPVTINAIGVRENIFAVLLGAFGVSTHEAVAFSWLAYGLVLPYSIVGGLVYLVRK